MKNLSSFAATPEFQESSAAQYYLMVRDQLAEEGAMSKEDFYAIIEARCYGLRTEFDRKLIIGETAQTIRSSQLWTRENLKGYDWAQLADCTHRFGTQRATLAEAITFVELQLEQSRSGAIELCLTQETFRWSSPYLATYFEKYTQEL